MKRKLTVLLTVLMVLALVMGITVACNPSNQPTNKVPAGPEGGTYYCDDGSDTYHISLKDDSKFTFEVAGENREGDYEFAGTALTMKFSETETVSAQLRDYNEMTFTYKNKNYTFLRDVDYTVSFESQGSAVTDRNVKNGRVLEEPNSPTKSGYFFAGWYEDAQYKTRFNFGTRITENKTLYGKFVEAIATDPEYTVTFVTGEGASKIDPMQTKGGMIDAMSIKPTKSGAEFLGWWVSHENDPNKLTYKYELERLYEDTTFYAVWSDGNPAVSVKDGEATWTGTGEATVEVTNPDGSRTNPTVSGNKATIAFNATGEYQIKVTVGGKTTTAYYTHNRISRVSVFKTDGDLLQFYKVPEADSYEVTLTHKDGTATLSTQDGGTSNVVGVDFHTYDIPENGYIFTIRATGNNKKESVSEYTLNRVLDKVTGFNVDNTTQELSWKAIEDARYDVKITLDGEEVYSDETSRTSYNMIELDRGKVVVEVTPKMFGWNSPETATYNYDKLKLSGVKNIEFGDNDTLTWDAVKDALGYELTINGKPHRTGSPTFQLKEDYLEGADSLKITIRATSSNPIYDSPESEEITVVAGKMGNVYYNEGILSWDAVFGVREFGIKINDEEEIIVKTKTNSTLIKLVAKQNHITVRIIKDNFNASSASTDVDAYEIKFDRVLPGSEIPSLFKATGDPLDFMTELDEENRTYPGYDFSGWYDSDGLPYEDDVFNETKDLQLSAHWNPHRKYIEFDLRGGAVEDELEKQELTFGSTDFNLPVPTSARAEYAFQGWYNAKNGEQITDEKGNALSGKYFTFSDDEDIVFYANWVVIFEFSEEADGTLRVKKSTNIKYVTDVTIPVYHNDTLITAVSEFSDLTTLERIHIPNTVTSINFGDTAASFARDRNLVEVEIYNVPDNKVTPKYFSDEFGVVYQNDDDGNPYSLVYYPYGKVYRETEYTILSGISIISNAAFNFRSASAPANFTLQTINIPSSVSRIEQNAFDSIASLKTVNFIYEQENDGAASSLEIRENAFYGCKAVTNITLPKRLSEIAPSILTAMEALESITVEPGGVYSSDKGILYHESEFGRELAFYPLGIKNAEYRIDDNVYSIGPDAFKKHAYLTSIIIPAQIENIGTSAFESCSKLSEITFLGTEEDKDLTIGEYVFYCSNSLVTSVKLPANLVAIGKAAFGGLYKLDSVEITTKGQSRTTVDFAAGAFLSLKSGSNAYVKNVKIGDDVPYFNVADVFGYSVQQIDISKNATYFYIDDYKVLYNKAVDDVSYFPMDWQGAYVVPEKMTVIKTNLFRGRKGLTEVTIHKDITLIQDQAFSGCTGLLTVKFGSGGSELTIGIDAFYNCSNLTTIELPDHLTTIKNLAFEGCSSLSSITIPKGVINLQVDDGSTYGGAFRIFNGCSSLMEVKVAEENEYYIDHEGVLYSLRKVLDEKGAETSVPDTLLYCPAGKSGKVTIPSSVREVAGYAFYNINNVKSIEFENLVKTENVVAEGEEDAEDPNILTLQAYAFYYSSKTESGIESIIFPHGLEVLPDYVIYNCGAIKTLTIPNTVTSIQASFAMGSDNIDTIIFEDNGTNGLSIEDGTGRDGTEKGAFSSMTKLTEITFPERTVYVGKYTFRSNTIDVKFTSSDKFELEIGASSFYRSIIDSLEIPKQTTKIGSTAFGYTTIKSLSFELPSKLTEIGSSAFVECKGITTITLPASLEKLDGFFNCTSLESVYFEEGSKLSSMAISAFNGCTSLKIFDFKTPDKSSTLTIGNQAFMNTSLSTFSIPQNVTTLGESVFSGCSKLTSVTFGTDSNGKTQLASIGNSAFAKTALTEIVLPDSVGGTLKLGSKLFSGCIAIETIKISNSVRSISNVFLGCSPTRIDIPSDHPDFVADNANSIIRNKADGSIVLVFADVKGLYKIPEGTVKISAGAFANLTSIVTLDIPTSVTTIEVNAFQNCVNLKTVTFHTGSLLESIASYAFQNCRNLTKISFENTPYLASIGSYCFQGCLSLNSVKFGKTKPSFNQYTFANSGIEEIDLSGMDMKTLSGYLFRFSKSLKKIILPENCTEIGSSSFEGCSALTTIEGIDKITKFGGSCLAGSGITSFTIKNGVTYGTKMFLDCKDLKEILLDDDLESATVTITANMFQNCTSLKEVDLSAIGTIKSLGASAFEGCTSLVKARLPESFTKLATEGVFRGCTSLSDFDFTQFTQIGKECFANTAFTTLTIPKSITSWGAGPFMNCTKLTELKFEDGCSRTGSNMFQGCTGIRKIDLSKSQYTALATSMFEGCTGLVEADISGEKIASLASKAFLGCSALTTVTLPSALTHAGTYTFQNCISLREIDFSNTKITRFSSSATANVAATTDSYVFAGCINLRSVKVPSSGFIQIAGYAFQDCKSLEEFDLSGVQIIGRGAFEGSGIKNINLSSITTLVAYGGMYPFAKCPIEYVDCGGNPILSTAKLSDTDFTALTSSDNTVTYLIFKTVGYDEEGELDLSDITEFDVEKVFNNIAGSYKKIILPSTMTEIPNQAFYGMDVDEVVLPEGLVSIGTQAFAYSKIKTLRIPASVEKIGQGAFAWCTELENITFDEGETPLVLTAGVYNSRQGTFSETIANLGVFERTHISSIALPKRLTDIPIRTFRYTTGPMNIVFADNVLNIENYTFTYSEMENLTFPESDTASITIGDYAFRYTKLKSVTIPVSVVSIGSRVFGDCQDLISVEFKGDTRITELTYTFCDCHNLQSVTFTNGITKFGYSVFQNCYGLTSVKLPETLEIIDLDCFSKANSLTRLELPENINSISKSAFDYWTSKQTLVFKNTRFVQISLVGGDWMQYMQAKLEFTDSVA